MLLTDLNRKRCIISFCAIFIFYFIDAKVLLVVSLTAFIQPASRSTSVYNIYICSAQFGQPTNMFSLNKDVSSAVALDKTPLKQVTKHTALQCNRRLAAVKWPTMDSAVFRLVVILPVSLVLNFKRSTYRALDCKTRFFVEQVPLILTYFSRWFKEWTRQNMHCNKRKCCVVYCYILFIVSTLTLIAGLIMVNTICSLESG